MLDPNLHKDLVKKISDLEEDNRRLHGDFKAAVRFLELMIENIPYPVFFKNAEGRYTVCNTAFAELNGHDREFFVGKTVMEAVNDKELANTYHKADMDLMHNKGKQIYVSQVKDSKGRIQDVIFNKIAILDSSGEVKGLLGFIVDITEQKKIERELKRKNEQYLNLSNDYYQQIEELQTTQKLLTERESIFRQLSENTSDTFILRNNDGELLYVSPNFFQLTGRNIYIGDRTPQVLLQWIHPEDSQNLVFKKEELLNGKLSSYDQECRMLMPDGSEKWIWIRGFSILNDNGQCCRNMTVITDISVRKKIEIQLENYSNNLEEIVRERTEEQETLNEELEATNEELSESNERIIIANRELSKLNDKLNNEIALRFEAQNKLEESEEKLSSFVQQSMDGIMMIASDGRIIEWNIAMSNITGIKKEKALDSFVWYVEKEINPALKEIPFTKENMHLFGLPSLQNLSAPIIQDQEIWNGEKNIYLNITSFPIHTRRETIIGRIFRDITQRKIAEAELDTYRKKLEQLVDERTARLMETQAIYRNTIEASPMGMHYYSLEKDNRLVFTGSNPAADKLIGISHNTLIGKTIEEAFPNLTETEVPNQYRKIAREGGLWSIENIFYEDDFVKGAFEVIAFQTAPGQMTALFNNITERIKANEELKRSEAKFKDIFNNSADMVFIIDEFKHIVEANQSAIDMLKYSKEELIGNTNKLFVPSRYNDILCRRYDQLVEGNTLTAEEISVITRDSEIIPVEIMCRMIVYNGKKAVLSIYRNIAERKEIDRKLINAIIETEEKERARLASDLHDEIGPLLSSIRMYLSTLSEKTEKEKQVYIIDQLNELVKNAVSTTRNISNDISPHLLTNHGLDAAVNSVVKNVTDFIQVEVISDIDRLRFPLNIEIIYYRIIKELINNTIKHAGAKNIIIKILYDNTTLMLHYSDNGKGYDIENLSNFSEKKGMGIYNMISRVRSIDGEYTIESSEGNGFTFTLSANCACV